MDGFIDLDRSFVRIDRDEESLLDMGEGWGRRYGGWLNWTQLHAYRRVVLLAEASSGKTAEFEYQTEMLRKAGKAAFFLRIEELADQGFEAALDLAGAQLFERWQSSTEDGWFFLDSVDEARLNNKGFQTALKRFARDLASSVERARVFVSCRVSDWRGQKDRGQMQTILPALERAQSPRTADDLLLEPIFAEQQQATTSARSQTPPKVTELLVIKLAPLSAEQSRKLAGWLGVADPESFMRSIERSGLDEFAERPGDLIDLADYWQTHGKFAALVEMVRHSVLRKLEESDRHRRDGDLLTLDRALAGAQRVAAALTFGKSFTLRAPGHDLDPSLVAGALDPAKVLPDWNPAEQNALLRRGVFAPATYGRVRFHHRSTQEYLTSCWLDRLLTDGCPRSELWDVIFANKYGIATVIPSLRPAAAWLALRRADFMRELMAREPLVLLRDGDPGSMPLPRKKELLAVYARKRLANEISDTTVDHRAMWLFAHPDLADAIRQAWTADTREDRQLFLLQLIAQGKIEACLDLARSVALDDARNDYVRHVALEAVKACRDDEGLVAASRQLMADPAKPSGRLVAWFAQTLYPGAMTTGHLLVLMEQSQIDPGDSTRGLQSSALDLYEACPIAERKVLVNRLVELCFLAPFSEEFRRLSQRFATLASSMRSIALRELKQFGKDQSSPDLVRLLMVVERAEEDVDFDEERSSIAQHVRSNPALERALFWADAAEADEHSKVDSGPVRFWQVSCGGLNLWEFREDSLAWLYEDVQQKLEERDRRIALSAIVWILNRAGRLANELARVRVLIGDSPVLAGDLSEYLSPPVEAQEARDEGGKRETRKRQRLEDKARAKADLLEFRSRLQGNPGVLCDPVALATWKDGASLLLSLTHWLEKRAGLSDRADVARHWRLLEEGFGRIVAEAYRDGMKQLWRITKPERPKQPKGGPVTTKWTSILSVGGIAIESSEDPEWASHLAEHEATRAALHGCLSGQGYPDWIEPLIAYHPDAVGPIVGDCIGQEWRSSEPGRMDFLHHFAGSDSFPSVSLGTLLLRIALSTEPTEIGRLDVALRFIRKLDLNADEKRKLARLARRRLSKHVAAKRTDFALRYLAMLGMVSPDRFASELAAWLAGGETAERKARAETTLGFLSDRHDVIGSAVLGRASVATLEELVRLAYQYVRPEDDVHHVGSYKPGRRDEAESARNSILTALVERSGADAYRSLRRLAQEPAFASRNERFSELAHGKAERDSEPPAWKESEVLDFEQRYAAPVKTGADLLRVVTSVISDIQFHLIQGDVSSRALLRRAADEEEVKNWIVEQMNFRSRGRFNAYREAQVAQGNRPDVIVSSTAAQCEVGMEVKHGGKGWTVKQLEGALKHQLAEDYLQPVTRRHGIFIVSLHAPRRWRTEKSELIHFPALINHLDSVAATITENAAGPVEVRAMGVDAFGGDQGVSSAG